jgi:2-keto-4-pentenoate hydratase
MPLSNAKRMDLADEVHRTRGVLTEVRPFSQRHPGFGLEDAYWIVEEMRRRREAAGERVVGRKIGFTNSAVWQGYGIDGPIWNYLYDRTTFDLAARSSFEVGDWPNVRMETEVALGLGAAPDMRMDERELLDCLAWAALDFEICSSIFPDWKFKAADAAATGVHVALFLGPRHEIASRRARWGAELNSFRVTLSSDRGASATGGGGLVLGGPVKALKFLVRELARFGGKALEVGDIVTTGTLTAALAAGPGGEVAGGERGRGVWGDWMGLG